MLKTVLAVVVGYVAMAAFVFVTFSVAYMVMGTSGSFQEGSYNVSFMWIVISIVLGLVAAILGGFLALKIGRSVRAVRVLAIVVLILGFVSAFMHLAEVADKPSGREGDVGLFAAMSEARQPLWIVFANPIIGAFGVMLAARGKNG